MTVPTIPGIVRKPVLFALVGGSVFVMMQLMLVVLVEGAYWNESVANLFVQAFGIAANYQLNRRWTWSNVSIPGQAYRFVVARLATALVSVAIFNLLLYTTSWAIWVDQAVGLMVAMGLNYVATDRWAFAEQGFHAHLHNLDQLRLGWPTLGATAIATVATLAALRYGAASLFVPALLVLLSSASLVAALLFLVSLLYPHRDEESATTLGLRPLVGLSRERIAILMPARHEVNVLGKTILNTALTQQDHPHYRLFPLVCDDDPDTVRVAIAAGRVANQWAWGWLPANTLPELMAELQVHLSGMPLDGSPLTEVELAEIRRWRRDDLFVQVFVYPTNGRKSSKAKQMNFALPYLWDRYSVFSILDAEDEAQPALLTHVDQAFQDHPGVSIIQGAVQLMPPQFTGSRRQRFNQACRRWFAWLNQLEYFRWFSGQMRFQSDRQVVPLGGNTVFLRADLLKATGGYIDSLAEDCATGILATAAFRAQTYTFYDPKLATREQTPPNVSQFIRQRVRWNQGFLQTLVSGHWRALPTFTQRLLALWILTGPFFQALSALLLPLTPLTMSMVKSPVPLVLVMYLPMLALAVATVLQVQQLHEFGRAYERQIPLYAYAIVVVLQIPYQLLLSIAALWAVLRHLKGNVDWHKTARPEDFTPAPTRVGAAEALEVA